MTVSAKVRLLLFVGVAGLGLSLNTPSWGIDPGHQNVLPQNSLVSVQIEQPMRLWDHPLIQQLWQTLQTSAEVQRVLASPELDQGRQVFTLLEKSMNTDWQTALKRLTAGGMTGVMTVAKEPKLAVILTADKPETLTSFVKFGSQLLEAEAQRNSDLKYETKDYRGVTGYQIDDAIYAIVGSRMLLTNDGKLMKQLVDKLLDDETLKTVALPQVADDAPVATASLNVKLLRAIPDVELNEVTLPVNDVEFVPVLAFLGGYLDLYHRANTITATLTMDKQKLGVKLHADAGKKNIAPGLEGFFATRPNTKLPPPLQLPNTLYTISGYRDLNAMWESRKKLATKKVIKQIEEADEQSKTDLSMTGVTISLGDAIRHLGTDFRAVVALQEKIPYNVELADTLPAGAVAISLRDQQQFLRDVGPLLRFINIIAVADQGNITTKALKYKDADLSVIWFRDEERAASQGDQIRFNFSPTITITRGHIIVGSTQMIVQQVIDELDRQRTHPESEKNLVGYQHLSVKQAAQAVTNFREALVRQSVLNNGFTFKEAEAEFTMVQKLLALLGEVEYRNHYTDDDITIEVKIGK